MLCSVRNKSINECNLPSDVDLFKTSHASATFGFLCAVVPDSLRNVTQTSVSDTITCSKPQCTFRKGVNMYGSPYRVSAILGKPVNAAKDNRASGGFHHRNWTSMFIWPCRPAISRPYKTKVRARRKAEVRAVSSKHFVRKCLELEVGDGSCICLRHR